MAIKEKQLRSSIRTVIKEFLFTSLLPSDDDEDEDEYSIAKRIGGRHTATLDYSESDEKEIEETEETEEK
tara:strand:+ start:1264 stop:1473 length:210 start_codon:yes stop_codon:yes gene_type:complete